VAGVACRLEPIQPYDRDTNEYLTHHLHLAPTIDIRDNYPNFLDGRDGDKVYIPQYSGGTLFRVVLVRRLNRGTTTDHKQVVLRRQAVTWPSDEV